MKDFDWLTQTNAAIIVGILFILPQIVALITTPGYQYFLTDRVVNDDFTYAARISALTQGKFQSDIVLFEHRQDSWPTEIIEKIVAFPIIAVSNNMTLLHLSFLFLAGCFSAIACMKLLEIFLEGKKARILAMILVLTSSWLYYFPPWSASAAMDMINAFPLNPSSVLGTLNQSNLIPYSVFISARMYFQMFSYPMLFALIFLVAKGWDLKNRNYLLAGGVICGLLAYTYIYAFVISGIILFIYFLRAIWAKNKDLVIYTGMAGAVALLISLPYVLSMVNMMGSPGYGDIEERLGAAYGRFIKSDMMLIKYLAIIAMLAWLRPRGWEHAVIPLLAISVAAGIHFGTGKFIQVEHFYAIGTPFLMIVFVSLIASWAEKNIDGRIFAILSIIMILILAGRAINSGLQLPGGETANSYQEKNELIKYIDGLPKDTVILSIDTNTNIDISALTGKYLFLPNAYLTQASTAEIEDRILLAYKYCKSEESKLESLLKGENQHSWFYLFHMKYECDPEYGKTKYCEYEAGMELKGRKMPKSLRDAKLEEYVSMQGDSLLSSGYRADYVVMKKGDGCQAEGEIVFSNGLFTVKKID
jgi:hypothetical protein